MDSRKSDTILAVLNHFRVEIPSWGFANTKHLRSRDISLWFADGSSYPGTANIRQRKAWFEDLLKAAHNELSSNQRLLIEYKPFEPAFYHTDIADWGMALHFARHAGPS